MPWTFNRHISGLKPAWGVHQSHRPKSGAVLGYTYDQIHLGHRRTTRFLKIWSKDFEDLCADRSVDWSTRSFGLQSQPAIDLSRDNPENLQKRSWSFWGMVSMVPWCPPPESVSQQALQVPNVVDAALRGMLWHAVACWYQWALSLSLSLFSFSFSFSLPLSPALSLSLSRI